MAIQLDVVGEDCSLALVVERQLEQSPRPLCTAERLHVLPLFAATVCVRAATRRWQAIALTGDALGCRTRMALGCRARMDFFFFG